MTLAYIGVYFVQTRTFCYITSICSVMSDFLWPHELQDARLPCPSLSPRVCSNSCPLSQCYHPTISSSITPFSSCPQSFPASGFSPMSFRGTLQIFKQAFKKYSKKYILRQVFIRISYWMSNSSVQKSQKLPNFSDNLVSKQDARININLHGGIV